MRRTAPILAFALALAAPAWAQDDTFHHTHVNNGHRVELRGNGEVEFNDEGDWVETMAHGARLVVEETGRGPDRRAEFRPEGGTVRVLIREDGRDRALDAAANAWLRGIVRSSVRESGLGARRRVARLRARGGVWRVLSEVRSIRSDSGKRLYLQALLTGGEMTDDEFTRTMDETGRILRSDTEKRLVLGSAGAVRARRLASLLSAAGTIRSDTEKRLVLTRAAGAGALEDPSARDAFFATAGGVGSSVERRLILAGALAGDPGRAVVLAALGAARTIGSDVEKRLVLTRVPAAHLRDDAVSRAYMAAAGTIGSETERGIALRHAARGGR